jgi:hypothetical protein
VLKAGRIVASDTALSRVIECIGLSVLLQAVAHSDVAATAAATPHQAEGMSRRNSFIVDSSSSEVSLFLYFIYLKVSRSFIYLIILGYFSIILSLFLGKRYICFLSFLLFFFYLYLF